MTIALDRYKPAVESLANESSRPVCAYIYDLAQLRQRAHTLRSMLPLGARLYYAVKANAEPRILATLAPVLDGFEVASGGELAKVRTVAPDASVLFGGPGKTDDELRSALLYGVRFIHVESVHELRRLDLIARGAATVAQVLLRAHLRGPLPSSKLSMAGVPTQFGIDEEHMSEVLALARRLEGVAVRGFHFHSLSNQLDERAHVALIARYLDCAELWQSALGSTIEVVNAGGGIGIGYHGEPPFDWPRFCEELGRVLRARPSRPELVFECGRFVSAPMGAYAVEVLDVKRNQGKAFAIVKGGTHHFRLPASWQHSHPFRVIPVERWPYPFAREALVGEPVTIAGQLCSPKDVLARDVQVEQLRIGDVILFELTGAYGWAISHHDFLCHPHPSFVFLDQPLAEEMDA